MTAAVITEAHRALAQKLNYGKDKYIRIAQAIADAEARGRVTGIREAVDVISKQCGCIRANGTT